MSQKRHRSSLFLLELIFVIFFFSLASAVCIQLFVKAHLTEQETEALNRAIPLAESAAEAFHSVSGNLEELTELFPGGQINEAGDSFQVLYDEGWRPVESGEGSYTLSITLDTPTAGASGQEIASVPSLKRAAVRISNQNGIVYELVASVQIPRKVPAR
ncbi:MAG: hypothetical protein HFI63_10005 [Lachnospiraceae bacterium]|nr:hypothetical protein [Lachnospiraceae bacterium]